MTKAIESPTTTAAPAPSRRTLLAGAALALASAGIAPAAAMAADPDSALIAAADRFMRAHGDLRALEAEPEKSEEAVTLLCVEWDAAIDALNAIPPPQSAAGAKAFATAAYTALAWAMCPFKDQDWRNPEGEVDAEEVLALRCLHAAAGLPALPPVIISDAEDDDEADEAVTVPHRWPDSDLMDVCAEFTETEKRYRAIFDSRDRIANDDEAKRLAASLESELDALLDRIGGMTAQTAAGIQARAAMLAAHNGKWQSSFDFPDTTTGRLLAYLMRDAAALAAAGAA